MSTSADGGPASAGSAETPRGGHGINLEAGAVSDLPSEVDLLGFAPLVEGLRALLNTRRTSLPLAIAIGAAWGAGKSSVMLQLRNLLRQPGDRHPADREWWTVDFPAWKYEHGERLWAALAKAIYEQPQKHMSYAQRIWFRVRVERARLGWLRFFLRGLWPPIAASAVVIVAVASLGPHSSIPAAGIISGVAGFLVAAGHYWGVASMPFKRAIESHSSAPDYDNQLGFTADADRDIRSLARVLAPDTDRDPHALAVFVDDLDRCNSPHVVEVVEAMNQIFNSDGRHGCVFVLGLDRDIVATNIEVAYGPTVQSLLKVSPSTGRSFGMHFLAKLVQISVAVPKPSESAVRRLLESITSGATEADPQPIDGEAVERVEAEIRRQVPEGLADVAKASSRVDASAQVRSLGERRVRAALIQDSPEVTEAEFALLPYLGTNPRQIKRFDNAFRLQLYVANEDPDCSLEFSNDELVALGRWVALRLRWPALAKAIDDEPSLLIALEATANESVAEVASGELERLHSEQKSWLEDRDVLAFLRDSGGEERQRVSSLDRGTFLRIA